MTSHPSPGPAPRGVGRPSAEAIAVVVADLRTGRVRHSPRVDDVFPTALDRVQTPQPVVDATALYWDLHRRTIAGDDAVRMYEDFPSMAPPWDDALVCYVNEHNNVLVFQCHAGGLPRNGPWDTPNRVDWFRVRWVIDTMVWAGGKDGTGAAMPTAGPIYRFQHAVYADGEPADIHWTQLLGGRPDTTAWEVPLLMLGTVLNFLNCTNVGLAEPVRPRPVRRRMMRTGVTVQTIVVRPPGKRSATRPGVRVADAFDTPLTSVRGHLARYGVDGRAGLLFGKYAGRFWIPAHARGGAEVPVRDYVLKPGRPAPTA